MPSLFLSVLAGAALLAAKPAVKDPYDPGTLWDNKTILRELGEAEKALDAELGRIPKRPRILISSREFAFERALEDERRPIKKLFPSADESFLRMQAAMTALSVFAFYEPDTNTIHIVSENFSAYARAGKDPSYLTPEFLRMVLVHELTHAYDNQQKGLGELRDSLDRLDQFKVFKAVSEGHAQYITQRIMTKMGRLADFKNFSDSIFNVAEDANQDPGQRLNRERAAANGRFGYVDGLAFFEGLEAEGDPKLVDAPFERMPDSVSVILHPERYSHPVQMPPRLELLTTLKRLMSEVEPSWKVMPIPLDENTIRSHAEPLLDHAKVEALLADFVGGATIGARPPPPRSKVAFEDALKGPPQSMSCNVIQMTTADGATRLLGMFKRMTTEEEKVITASGKVKLSILKDGDLKTSNGVTAFRHTRLFDDGTNVSAQTRLIFVRGSVLAGCDYLSSSHNDDVLAETVATFADDLALLDDAPAK